MTTAEDAQIIRDALCNAYVLPAALIHVNKMESRIAELEAALGEIGCRTDHDTLLNPCPICEIIDRVIK